VGVDDAAIGTAGVDLPLALGRGDRDGQDRVQLAVAGRERGADGQRLDRVADLELDLLVRRHAAAVDADHGARLHALGVQLDDRTRRMRGHGRGQRSHKHQRHQECHDRTADWDQPLHPA